MLPLCADEHIGVIPWSPLARGRLTREPDTTTQRSADDPSAKLSTANSRRTGDHRDRRRDRRKAQCPSRPVRAGVGICPPRGLGPDRRRDVGVTKPNHLRDAIASPDVHLSERVGEEELR